MYFLGIAIALISSALDVVTYYIIRKVGMKINAAFFPFVSGIFTVVVLVLYCSIKAPFDFGYFFRDVDGVTEEEELKKERDEYWWALVLASIGCFMGWVAIEFMIIGLRISKSALASYAE